MNEISMSIQDEFIIKLCELWKELQVEYGCYYDFFPVTRKEYYKFEGWMRKSCMNLSIHYFPYARCHFRDRKGDKARVFLFKEKLEYVNIHPSTVDELLIIFDNTLRHEMGHCLVYRWLFEEASEMEQNDYFSLCDNAPNIPSVSDDLSAYYAQPEEQYANLAAGITSDDCIALDLRLAALWRDTESKSE